MRYTAYVSQHCPNCRRFVESVRASPSAKKDIRVVDIDTLSQSQRDYLQVVPTVQTPEGRALTGSAAFELLKGYESDMELEPWSSGGGGVVFSDFASGDGIPHHVQFWEEFTPLEDQ